MSELEKMEAYIERTRIPRKDSMNYGLCYSELCALLQKGGISGEYLFDVIDQTFRYGMAKGYRAGRRAAK